METPVEFRPECFSRRGEITAWGLAIFTLAGWFALRLRGLPVPLLLSALAIFLVLAAFAVSLSNWSDRRTLLRLEADGVRFENGLRRVYMPWKDIQMVQIFPSNLGDQVRVTGARTFFNFRMLGEVSLRGQVRGRLGFSDGDRILQHILEAAQLKRVEGPGAGYTYARR